jgi:hypothetical protein
VILLILLIDYWMQRHVAGGSGIVLIPTPRQIFIGLQ